MPDVVITSGTTYVIPGDCAKIDFLDCIGGGGSGAASNGNGVNATGGGGGGWSRTTNLVVTPGSTVSIQVGSGGAAVSRVSPGAGGGVSGNAGTDTWFVNTSTCLAKGGGGGVGSNPAASGGAGGAAAVSLPCAKGGGKPEGVDGGIVVFRRLQSPSQLRCQPPLHKGAFSP